MNTWSTFQKLLFRFLFSYTVLFCLYFQFVTTGIFIQILTPILPWFGNSILGLEEEIAFKTTGSGDGIINYVALAFFLVLAIVSTIIWSILDRKRDNYSFILDLWTLLLRYYLAFQMILYGFAKVFYLQFQEPAFLHLITTFGDSSPMGLLWKFMGFSKAYTIFTGWAELIGGILVLFRQTRLIGALIVFGVMTNVMMLNFCYDVPVKILSSHIVFLSLILIAFDAKRLWTFFFTTNSPALPQIRPLFKDSKIERTKNWIKLGLVFLGLIGGTALMKFQAKSLKPDPKDIPLYGLYEVIKYTQDGVEKPLALSEASVWRYLILERKKSMNVVRMDNSTFRFRAIIDSLQNTINFHPRSDSLEKFVFTYEQLDSTRFQFDGVFRADTLSIECVRKTKDDFLLMNRGFHWVSEDPYNR